MQRLLQLLQLRATRGVLLCPLLQPVHQGDVLLVQLRKSHNGLPLDLLDLESKLRSEWSSLGYVGDDEKRALAFACSELDELLLV